MWIARLTEQGQSYGPFEKQPDAALFADFLTAEVDPAKVERLLSPALELLGWWSTRRSSPIDFGIRPAPSTAALTAGIGPAIIRPDGHTPDCALTAPHFFPNQCRPC